MLYEYRSADGQRIERDFPMGCAPEALREGRRTYTRVFSFQRPYSSKPIVGNSLPDRRVMPPELAGKVDGWSPEGAPVFTSRASARRFSEESKRLHAAGKTAEEWHFGDVPTGAEVRQAKELAVKKYRADMLKRPRPKGF